MMRQPGLSGLSDFMERRTMRRTLWVIIVAFAILTPSPLMRTNAPGVFLAPQAIAAESEEPAAVETEEVVLPDTWELLSQMSAACLSGDHRAGREAETIRNRAIEAGAEGVAISYDDLNELAKIITAESGSSWIPLEWKMAVGEVVLNRVESPEFPDTIYDVIHAKGQYSPANKSFFKTLIPYEDCIEAAARLLCGERVLNEPSVVFQANFRQGSGVHTELYDGYYGSTYLCYSHYPELYEE